MATEEQASAAPQTSMLQTLQGLWHELPGLISDRVDLLTLELRRASRALMQIMVLAVAATLLGVTAWLAMWAAVVGLLMIAGLHWSLALLVVLVVNLGVLWWAVARMRSLLPDLKLPATRRHLAFSPSPKPESALHTAPASRAQATPPHASNTSHAAGNAVPP